MFDVSGGSLVGLWNLIFRIKLCFFMFFQDLLCFELLVDLHIVFLLLVLFALETWISLGPPLDDQLYLCSIDLTSILYIFKFGQRILVTVLISFVILHSEFMQSIFGKIDIDGVANLVDLSDCTSTFETRSITGDGNNFGLVLLREVAIWSRSWRDILNYIASCKSSLMQAEGIQ